MNEKEKQVAKIVRDVTTKVDISNDNNIQYILRLANNNPLFQNSICGNRFIKRLQDRRDGKGDENCIFCGKTAKNKVICTDCMSGNIELKEISEEVEFSIKNFEQQRTKQSSDYSQIEELFKDIDDSLLQVASQNTVSSIKKLTWITLGLTIFNSIAIFFLAIFLWKYMIAG